MLLDNKKLKLTLVTLFVGAWIFGVGQLGYDRFHSQENDDKQELVLNAESAPKLVKNKSVILTGIVGVFRYIYQK